MRRRALAALFACALLAGCAAQAPASDTPQPQPPEPAPEAPTNPAAELPELAPLVMEIGGEPVTVLDTADPLVRALYTGCPNDTLPGAITVRGYADGKPYETAGHADARYAHPLYRIEGSDQREQNLQWAADLLGSTQRLSGLLTETHESAGSWRGIVFDTDGVPVTQAEWDDDGRVRSVFSHIGDEIDRYENPAHAMSGYFEPYSLADTRRELLRRGFDPDRITVEAGWLLFGPGYLLTDGEREIFYYADGLFGSANPGTRFVTAEVFAAKLLEPYIPAPATSRYLSQSYTTELEAIYISNGSAYKAVTDPGEIARIQDTLLWKQPLLANVQMGGEITGSLQIILGSMAKLRLYETPHAYYYSDNEAGLCLADYDWGRRVFALYDSLDAEELRQADFEEILPNPLAG